MRVACAEVHFLLGGVAVLPSLTPAHKKNTKKTLKGPLQRQGTKSLIWVVNLSEALEEVGAELTDGGGNLPVALAFDLTWVPKRRRG